MNTNVRRAQVLAMENAFTQNRQQIPAEKTDAQYEFLLITVYSTARWRVPCTLQKTTYNCSSSTTKFCIERKS